MEVNIAQREHFMSKVLRHFGKNLTGRTFAVLGLAFKGNTDDIRDSVSIEIVKRLRGLGAALKVYDPEAMYNAKQSLGSVGIEYCLDKYETMQGSDALFILTEWKEFATIEMDRVKNLLVSPVIFDGRNLLDRKKVEQAGFTYFAVGKRTNGMVKIDTRNLYATVLLNTNGSIGQH
jgi:UDPglucose 6-dehydrogenase